MAEGFCWVDILPLPRSHDQEVGLLLERSWKVTISGEQPEIGVAVKLAVGACAKTQVVPSRLSKKTRQVFTRAI